MQTRDTLILYNTVHTAFLRIFCKLSHVKLPALSGLVQIFDINLKENHDKILSEFNEFLMAKEKDEVRLVLYL